MENTFFEGIEPEEVEITDGTCQVPILYHDIFAIAGVFVAPTLALRELLPTSKLVPVELLPGKGLLGFMAADYRETSIGPYREFIVMIPARYRPRLNTPLLPALRMSFSLSFETFIWQLPLTSDVGLHAGIDIWGFPKFLADIDFSEDEKTVSCSLAENGEHILTLEVQKTPAKLMTYFDYTIFSVKDRELLQTHVNGISDALGRNVMPGKAGLVLGEHPISRQIREVAPGKSVLTLYIPKGQLILPEANARLPL
ncbi:MAG: acetoacetate decarboxylase family protein [Actinomycetota bacterium]|nr:acetoacetate decarboxylase family protein [Actinomycetota bacterium]